MSRLTNDIRNQMARKLVNHRYTDEAKELVRLNRDLAERAYDHCYTKTIIAHMDAIKKAYNRAFDTRDGIYVNAGGYKLMLGGTLHNRWVNIPQQAARMYTVAESRYHNITDEKLIEEIKVFATRQRGFDDVCQTAYSEAMSVLQTMTSGKKLAEAWPEAIPVIGDLIPENQRTLPVVQVSAINAKFKLPPETTKKENV
jgi:hypothetical protein